MRRNQALLGLHCSLCVCSIMGITAFDVVTEFIRGTGVWCLSKGNQSMGDLDSNNYCIGLVSFQTHYCRMLVLIGKQSNFGNKHECC